MSPLTAEGQKTLQELGFALQFETECLSLLDLKALEKSPLAVDFLAPKILYRLRHGSGKDQPLARALGVRTQAKAAKALEVFDATAGLGVDAFFIAAVGCRVRALERSEIVYALLADGYRRLRESADARLISVGHRLSFEQGDAAVVLDSLSKEERPDVVYMDPMYPNQATESALPKKAMQMFRRLIGPDADAGQVFASALKTARLRVVVKRPLQADPIAGRPTHVFKGKTARYDMYLTGSER